MTLTQIQDLINQAIKDGHWMLRRSNDGRSYKGFQWNPIGEWTEAPDWKPTMECGHGLHGNDRVSLGHWPTDDYPDLDFCIYDSEDMIRIDQKKIKVRRAMILLRNQLPVGFTTDGNLDLSYTNITVLPEGLVVGGSLDLRYSKITELPTGLKVGGYLDFGGTKITTLPARLTVNGSLFLHNTKITELSVDLIVGGNLYFCYKLPAALMLGGEQIFPLNRFDSVN